MRKYFTEFGLNVYTSYKTLIPVNYLDSVKHDAEYHIYMVLSAPKAFIERDSIVKKENALDLELLETVENGEIKYTLSDFKMGIGLDIDYRDTKINIKRPFDNMDIIIKNKLNYLGQELNTISVPSDVLRNTYYLRNHKSLVMDVLYIGQGYGRKTKRYAQDRLSSHEKLQKILSDCHSKYPDKNLYILLLEMTPILNTTHDGISKQYKTDMDENNKHLEEVMSELPIYEQVINITEAALINFFKPKYNEKFVENFPDPKHSGYRQYYNLDYNCITVELDLEFDSFPHMILQTDTNAIKSSFDFIRYNLFNNDNRDNMYDIFKK